MDVEGETRVGSDVGMMGLEGAEVGMAEVGSVHDWGSRDRRDQRLVCKETGVVETGVIRDWSDQRLE